MTRFTSSKDIGQSAYVLLRGGILRRATNFNVRISSCPIKVIHFQTIGFRITNLSFFKEIINKYKTIQV